MRFWLLALVCMGCSPTGTVAVDDGSDGSDGSDGGDGGDPTCERPHLGLEDLSANLGEWDCDIQHATGVAGVGATSYFYGVYKESHDGFNGFEEWILFANDTWADEGGYDCVMRWNVSAVTVEPESCAACDVALEVLLTLDETCSTCPQDMIDAEIKNSSVGYEILRSSTGTSRWFFSGSGTEFGEGKANAKAMNFVSEDSCTWF